MSVLADEDGQTPLHLAAYEPRPEVLRWLVAQGLPRDALDHRERRALDVAFDTQRFARRTTEDKLALVQLLDGDADDVARGRFADHPLHRTIAARDLRWRPDPAASGGGSQGTRPTRAAPLYAALAYSNRLPHTPAERTSGRKLLPLLLRHGADPRSCTKRAWAAPTSTLPASGACSTCSSGKWRPRQESVEDPANGKEPTAAVPAADHALDRRTR
ncbi:MAG: hypothetical protein MNPFHGCM_02806 [Gemmatimonadaceae bacterium]|nr:hypothetical protein [Gemmatimonadaceae bacterium]